MKKPHRPFRHILSSQLLIIALAPLVLTGLLLGVLIAPKIAQEAENYHRNLTGMLATRIKSYLYERAASLQAINMAIREKSAAETIRILDDRVIANPIFEAIYLIDPEDKVLAVGLPANRQSQRDAHLDTSSLNRTFLINARKNIEPTWSDIFVSKTSNRISVAVASASQKNLLVGEISLHRLQDYLNQLHDNDIRSVIIGQNGEIIAQSNSVQSSQIESRGLPQMQAGDGLARINRFHLDGMEMMGSIDTLQAPRWKILVYEPASSAYRNVYEMVIILAIVVVLALLAVFAISMFYAKKLTRRFEEFSKHADSIATANYTAPTFRSNILEIHHFTTSLHQMAAAVEDREHKLRLSERKYRNLVEGSHDLIVLCDAECIVLYANHTSTQILGLEPEACVGRSGFEFVHPDDRDALQREMDKWRVEKPSSVLLENRLMNTSGEVRHILWSISIHPLNDTKTVEFLGIGRDTTERKQHEVREQRLINLQRALSETNDAILRLETESALFPLTCRIAVEYGGMMLAWIGILEESGTKIVPAASFGRDTSYLDGIEISATEDKPTGRGPTGICLREKRHVIVNDYSSNDLVAPWRKRAQQYGIQSGAFFPVLRNGKPYAIFAVNSDLAGAFDEEIEQLLKEIAANISFALDNFDREAARRKAEAALRTSEERFRTITSASPFPMQIHTEEGEILFLNQAWTEVTGYTLEDIPTMQEWINKACGEQAEQALANIRNLFNHGRTVSEEYLLTCKDGSRRICYFTSSPIDSLHNGKRAMISMAVDVTERRVAEKALQLTHFSVNQASDPLFWVAHSGDIHFVNDAACKVLGYPEEELLSLSVMDINPEKTIEAWNEIWRELKEKKTNRHEATLITKSGNQVQVEITSNFVSFEGEEYNCAFVRDITEKKKTEELVWQQANYDTLTGLPNRSMFLSRLELEMRKADRSGLPAALFFLDLDHFKNVNDTLGHNTGDLLLQEAAERLLSCVRETDTVARLGGDEFTVILPELQDTNSIERIARKIQERICEPFYLGDEMVYVSTSIGITLYPEDATDIDELLKNADQAMYAAKHEGRKQHHYFTQSMQEAAQSRMRLIKDLRHALEGDQFEVVYQPIVELSSGIVRKAEALVRWRHPTRGVISPSEFVPIAEEIGLIHEIGDWIFWQAADQATTWREKLHPQFQISVNMSPIQFRENEKSRAAWLQYLQSLEIPWLSITVEITEGLLLDGNSSIHEQLLAFHDAGMEVAIDDFGIGYSSLSYLKKFDIDYLKIDRSFVSNLEHDSHDMALCEAIIVMAHKLGIKVIAEGVESERQRVLLTEAGCDFAQGYLFSTPLSPRQFSEQYKKRFAKFGNASLSAT